MLLSVRSKRCFLVSKGACVDIFHSRLHFWWRYWTVCIFAGQVATADSRDLHKSAFTHVHTRLRHTHTLTQTFTHTNTQRHRHKHKYNPPTGTPTASSLLPVASLAQGMGSAAGEGAGQMDTACVPAGTATSVQEDLQETCEGCGEGMQTEMEAEEEEVGAAHPGLRPQPLIRGALQVWVGSGCGCGCGCRCGCKCKCGCGCGCKCRCGCGCGCKCGCGCGCR